ncbi:MAG: sulfatase [Pirellulaceae bacterium]|nr:sulfatase [Pirellulaceae bacterium]
MLQSIGDGFNVSPQVPDRERIEVNRQAKRHCYAAAGVCRLLLIIVLIDCTASSSSGESGAPRLSKPNIVLFLVDDMGIMDTSVPFLTDAERKPIRYPLNDAYRTPNMERLAAHGIRFNNFCAMSVCSPTRISIMTGQNAARHRTTNWINPDQDNGGPQGPPSWNWQGLNKSSITLARILQTSGYRTFHVGKGHFGPRGSEGADPTNLGFDVNVAGCSIGAPGSYYGNQNYGNLQPDSPRGVPQLKKYHGTDTFLTEALTQEAKSLVTAAVQAHQPFFLYMPHYAVHGPFNPDPRFIVHYQNSERPKSWQAFASLIEGMDRSLGELLDHVESLGVAENTLILFLGDNGSDAPLGHEHAVACAAPLRGRKGSHYEGGMRVPFIVAWAKSNPTLQCQVELPIAANAIQPQLATVYDLFPTLLNVAGATAPHEHVVDGRPLNTLLTGQSDVGRSQDFLMHYPHAPHRSDYFTTYREGPWKAIYHYFPTAQSAGRRYQLFNLSQDPFEQADLSDGEPEVLGRMMNGMVAALHRYSAVFPIDATSGQSVTPIVPQP